MPLFLSENRPSYRTVLDHERRSVRKGRITPVRDTCEKCNGGPLSRLDDYASTLDRVYFTQIVDVSPDIKFRYDFDRLLRWLLKLSYNDDRTRPPPYEMQIFVPYILGNAAELPLHTTLLLSLITPSKTTSDMKTRGIPDTLEPESCGVGRLYLNPPAKADVAIGRIVQINSYLFSVIAWRPRLSRPTWRSHIANICRVGRCFELRPRAKSVRLNRASMDFVSFQSQHMIRHWNPFRTTGGIS